MGEAFLDYKKGGSGLDINGIIEDYYVYAGEKVNAGDFVEFINGVAGQTKEASSNIALSSSPYLGCVISACKLSENKVFIAHSTNAPSKSSCYVAGIVVTIEGATINVGTDTTITSNTYDGSLISVVALSETSVFIANSPSDYLYGTVCTIAGTAITKGTTVAINTESNTLLSISTEFLSNGKVLVTYGRVNSVKSMVCTISGTSITSGTITTLNNSYSSGSSMSTCLLPNDRVFVSYGYGTNFYLYGIVCSISGTTITKGTETSLKSTTSTGKVISVVPQSDNRVFISHSYGTSSSCTLYGLVCTTSGLSITNGTDTLLSNLAYSGNKINSLQIKSNKVLILHSVKGNYFLYGMICTTNGTSISVGTDKFLTKTEDIWYTADATSNLMVGTNILITHSYDSSRYLHAQVFGLDEVSNILTESATKTLYETQVRPATSLPCNGVASTSGEGGDSSGHKDIVSVYTAEIPKPTNLVVNGDFSNGVSGWYYDDVNDFGCFELSAENNILAINIVDTSVGNEIIKSETNINTVADHIYYARMEAKSTSNGDFVFNMVLYGGSSNIITNDLVQDGEWHILSLRGVTKEASYPLRFACYKPIAGNTIECKNVAVYDLTARYGAGNEPTQEWCDANL